MENSASTEWEEAPAADALTKLQGKHVSVTWPMLKPHICVNHIEADANWKPKPIGLGKPTLISVGVHGLR